MPILTGSINGTNQADSLIGEETLAFAPNPFASGIQDATLNAKGDNDSIIGEGSATLTGNGFAIGNGIETSRVFAADGDDSISAIGTGNGIEFGQGTGVGVVTSQVFGGAGKDIISLAGIGNSTSTALGFGLVGSVLNSGADDDTVKIKAEVAGAGLSDGTSTGVDRSTVTGADGNDSIDIQALSLLEFFPPQGQKAIAEGAKDDSKIFGGAGNDNINLLAQSRGDEVSSTGVSASRVVGLIGDDIITITADADGLNASDATGITGDSFIGGGDGSDQIKIVTDALGGGPTSGSPNAIGVKGSTVFGGFGDDVITLETNSSGTFGKATGISAQDSTIAGGLGNDTITLNTNAGSNGGGTANGLLNSRILAGDGDDTITVETSSRGEDAISGSGSSAKDSEIFGGLGDDTITLRMSFGRGYELEDTLIAGGQGDDTIDAGIGNGTIRGGAGTDTVVLDFLDRAVPEDKAFSVAAIGNGIEISGSVDKTFFSGDPWKQQIFSAETFKVGEVTYSAEELVAAFG